ncbi:sensor histidine kinase [Nonomuraea thailandensis]
MVTPQRWERALAALPYLLVLLPALFSLLREWRPEVLALALFAAAWHWLVVTAHPAWAARRWVVIVYFAVLLAAIAALVRIDTVFTVTGVGTFLQCFALLPGLWAYAGVAVTVGVLVAARPADGRPRGTARLLRRGRADLLHGRPGLPDRLRAERAAQAHHRRIGSAGGGERRSPGPAPDPGPRGRRARRAPADGQEIHDTIAQGLTAILTQLEALGDVPGAGERLATVRGLARESLAEARRSVHALRPVPLEGTPGFAAALSGVAGRWSRVSGVPATVSVTGDARPLHAEVETTLLRVAQEALANVARHASAGRVVLTLSYMDDVVALDVRDDGAGFVHEPGRSSGFGLVGMRQRVIRLAGSFEIETAPGQGTGISATVPAIPAAARS